MEKPRQLTEAQWNKLAIILDCTNAVKIERLKVALVMAERYEEWSKFWSKITTIASWAKSVIITTAALLLAMGAINVAIKNGVSEWLFGG